MRPQFDTGAQIAGYRVESLIGRGGMGVVYLAEQLALGRKVAVKILSPALSEDDDFRRRFKREALLAASLQHPNIIPVHDAGENEHGLLYLVMSYVQGPDLGTLIETTERLPAQETLRILDQVASALDKAHRQGLVHRDVKPANILVEEGTSHVYLTDFGLTRRLDSRTNPTPTGKFLGTLPYIAPEQIQGRDVDGRTDLYSLGCVMFECLTGHVPFERDNDVARLFAHLSDPVPLLTDLNPDLPRGVDRVVAKAMAKMKEDRFSTCAEFLAEARSALKETMPVVVPPWLVEPSDGPIERELEDQPPRTEDSPDAEARPTRTLPAIQPEESIAIAADTSTASPPAAAASETALAHSDTRVADAVDIEEEGDADGEVASGVVPGPSVAVSAEQLDPAPVALDPPGPAPAGTRSASAVAETPPPRQPPPTSTEGTVAGGGARRVMRRRGLGVGVGAAILVVAGVIAMGLLLARGNPSPTPSLSGLASVGPSVSPTTSTSPTPSASIAAPPPAPTLVHAAPAGQHHILVTWTEGSPHVLAFHVLEKKRDVSGRLSADRTSFRVPDLGSGSRHCYQVVAVNQAGTSARSIAACATTKQASAGGSGSGSGSGSGGTTSAPPATPSVSVNCSGPTSCTVSWTESSSNVTSFTISGDGSHTASAGDRNFTFRGLSPGQTYCYSVKANNGAVSSGADTACGSTP